MGGSFSISAANQTVSATTTYTLLITREGSTLCPYLDLSWLDAIDTSAVGVTVNGNSSTSSPQSPSVLRVDLPPSQGTVTVFTIIITNVGNPSYSLTLSSLNVNARFSTPEIISLQNQLTYSTGNLLCSWSFGPYTNTLGAATVVVTTTHPLTSPNNILSLVYVDIWGNSGNQQLGLVASGAVNNTITVSGVTVTDAGGIIIPMVYTFTYTRTETQINLTGSVPASSTIRATLTNINTPPLQKTPGNLVRARTLNSFGVVDYNVSSCVIVNIPLTVLASTLSQSLAINANVSNPIVLMSTNVGNNVISVSSDSLVMEYPSSILFWVPTIRMRGSSGQTLTLTSTANSTASQTFEFSIDSNDTIVSYTLPSQVFNFTLEGHLTMTTSAKPLAISFTFFRNNIPYMNTFTQITAIPGSLTAVSLFASPNTVGSTSTLTITFQTSQNLVPSSGGILVTLPS